MRKSDFWFVFASFSVWRIFLFVLVFIAVLFVEPQKSFLGGGTSEYLNNPHLWSWANFDGEHYLSIARHGYKPLQYFFFPVYPLFVRQLSSLFAESMSAYLLSGLLLSHISFFAALLGLIKLIKIDNGTRITRNVLILLFLFPTSFYFASYYTESIYLALSVWAFYFARNKKWFIAGVLGALLTATRIVGLALFPAFIIEILHQNGWNIKKVKLKDLTFILLVPAGIMLYMVYLNKVAGDPFEFFNNVTIYGEQRSNSLIILPQVFYRYVVKILPNINYDYFPVVFTTFLEFVTATVFLLLIFLSSLNLYLKLTGEKISKVMKSFELRQSYLTYLAIGYIIPTLSGSFSSLPRYVVVLFPAFILISKYLNIQKKPTTLTYYILSAACLVVSCVMFVSGYWVA